MKPSLSLFGRRDSLVRQASVDRLQNEGLRRRNTIRSRKELESSTILNKQLLQLLNDDGIALIKDASDEKCLHFSLILNCSTNSRQIMANAIQKLAASNLSLKHIESRADKAHIGELEFFAECEGKKWMYLDALTKLLIETPHGCLERIQLRDLGVIGEHNIQRLGSVDFDAIVHAPAQEIWFPRHVSELDQCAHVVVKYEPTADPKHPGYGDEKYIARRAELNAIANSYKFGEPIPIIDYTDEENATWKIAYAQLRELRVTHTCIEYQQQVEKMEKAGVITSDRIPQLKELSAYIQRQTGFELRPCGGLLSARDFLASLAFRIFQATLYVRHSSAAGHCPEPDIIHEVLGHCPMFAEPALAELSQEIGLLSLGASDEQIEKLATVYWFIIEFGLCRDSDGSYRAIGAGLISAFGELQHACSDVPAHEPFEPEVTALRSYEDSDFSSVYFIADSIRGAMEKLRIYARRELAPLHIMAYSPLTRTVERFPLRIALEKKLQKWRDAYEEIMRSMKQLNMLDG